MAALALALIAIGAIAYARMRPPSAAARADAWWADIAAIADDRNEGRQTGSPGFDRAAAYVVGRFRELKLSPAGDDGDYRQMVSFEQQVIDHAASTAVLTGPGGDTALTPGDALLIASGGARRPASVDAPLVFIGYGLHLPALGHDDLAGVDLKGKIAVVIAGGPADLPGPAKAANRGERAKFLAEAGAVGLLSIGTPGQVEIPWARLKLLAPQPGMYLADSVVPGAPGWYVASVDPARGEALFADSGHRYAELAALADASRPMPRFALPRRFVAHTAASRSLVTSPNLIARLDGSDPTLASEYVLLSAHLDHLGIGAPIAGKRIYNGAMDDASGVASVLDMARHLAAGPRPRRSILFVIHTAEEKGLLGATWFARHPTVPEGSIVADLNLDMPLPLWPLTSILAQGDHESTLGDAARAEAAARGLALVADPLPERNSFVRTDQFAYVHAGIPALAFKFGFPRGTNAFQIEHDWRANRYHSPADDLDQPGVLHDQAIRFDDYVAGLAARVANDPARPAWLPTSVFRPVG